MHKFVPLALVAALALTGVAAAAAKPQFHGSALAPQAKVSLTAARKAALAVRPGTVTDQELEKERGGSGLRYSFDIRSHGKTFEVGVDAATGKVLENSAEGAHPD